MLNKDSHEELCNMVEEAFNIALKRYATDKITDVEFTKIIQQYLNEKLDIKFPETLYIKTIIGDITYMDVSNILDDLIKHTSVQEKCCKYNVDNKIFTVVLSLIDIDNFVLGTK